MAAGRHRGATKKIGMKWNGMRGRLGDSRLTGDAISRVEAFASTGHSLLETILVAASEECYRHYYVTGDPCLVSCPFLGSMIGTETCSFKRTFLTSLGHLTSFHVSLYELITVRDGRPFKVE